MRVKSLLPPCIVQGWNRGQTWQQASLPADPSYWPHELSELLLCGWYPLHLSLTMLLLHR